MYVLRRRTSFVRTTRIHDAHECLLYDFNLLCVHRMYIRGRATNKSYTRSGSLDVALSRVLSLVPTYSSLVRTPTVYPREKLSSSERIASRFVLLVVAIATGYIENARRETNIDDATAATERRLIK